MTLFESDRTVEVVRTGCLRLRCPAAVLNESELESLRQAFIDRFNRDNPVYFDARRWRRPCRHIPRRVDLFVEVPDSGDWILPRGAEPEVMALLARTLPGCPVVPHDQTVSSGGHGLCLAADLRDYQIGIVERALSAGQGVVHAPTGSGKTVMACGLIAATGMNTIVVVHTSVLFEQTAAAVRKFLDIEPGMVGAGQDHVAPVTVAMVQTLGRRDLAQLHERFGMVILDEAHHCPAESFKSVVASFPARYRFGLTATPSRKDRLHPVLYDVIGPVVASVDAKSLMASGSITPIEVVRIDTGFKTGYTKDYGKLISRIAKNRARNELVVNAVCRHMGERTLVLSERVVHCSLLAGALNEKGVNAAAMTGSMSREDRGRLLAEFQSGSLSVLVSTSSLAGEGFDLPALDTVVITIPNGNAARTTQFLGRAIRPFAGKKEGRIVDFCDGMVSLLANQFKRRAAVYRRFAVREISESWPPSLVE